ncbi:MAG: ACT domain-containing protein [Cytophagales bacterium]|nr:ACT domain-containing protein [Cytophagales bacterium]
MAVELDLKKLLLNMTPRLNGGEYVFVSIADPDEDMIQNSVASIKEKEGVTLIVSKEFAVRRNLNFEKLFSWISLEVHSSLEAVGLTATFSKALADNEISCNVIAGYYHDHIFVPTEDSNRALLVLQSLAGI